MKQIRAHDEEPIAADQVIGGKIGPLGVFQKEGGKVDISLGKTVGKRCFIRVNGVSSRRKYFLQNGKTVLEGKGFLAEVAIGVGKLLAAA